MPPSALVAHDLVRTLGARRVLDGISLTGAPGQRIGLIGENGVGKSTLLRLLAGADEPDGGAVVRPRGTGFLHQEMPFHPGATIGDVVDDALREAREDLAQLDRLTRALAGAGAGGSPGSAGLLAEYGEWLERAEDHDAWDAGRRAGLVMAGLGLGGLPHSRRLSEISGGQRSRLALAALLVRRPAALLLDEPTNHLDDDAAAFLEAHLRDLAGTVVLASHDRVFLDAVCTDLIDLDPALGGPVRYGGGYTAYQAAKRAERERWERRFAGEQEELAGLRHSAAVTARNVAPGRARRDHDKMGYGRRAGRVEKQVSRRVRDATRRLGELERDQVRKPPEPLRFRAPVLAAASAGGVLVSLRGIQVPGRLTLSRLDVLAGDRLLITGPNGAGKSTLLAVIAGHLDPGGEVRRRRGLRIGLLAQDTMAGRLTAPRSRPMRPGWGRSGPGPCRCAHSASWPRATWRPGSAISPQASGGGSPSRWSSPTRRTCCCSTSPPTTSPPSCPTNWRARSGRARVRSSPPPTTGGCGPGGQEPGSGSVAVSGRAGRP